MNKKRIICIAAAVLCSAVFAFSAYKIGEILFERRQSNNEYNQIVSEAMQVKDASKETQSPELKLEVDFGLLKAKNSDTVGWIYLPGTKINYPVLQTENNDYYLNTLFSGEKNSAGSIFADYRCNNNTNLILYGHNMKNGTMFAPLIKYSRNRNYHKDNPVIYYADESGTFNIEVFAGVKIKGTEMEFYPLSFKDEAQFNRFVEKAKSRSGFKSDVIPQFGERIAILSTCSYETNNSRYVVMGIIKESR